MAVIKRRHVKDGEPTIIRHIGPTNSNVIDMQAAIDRYADNVPESEAQAFEDHRDEWAIHRDWFLLIVGILALVAYVAVFMGWWVP